MTIKAAVSKKGNLRINTVKYWATKRMVSIPIKTPKQTKATLGVNATAANTLSIEKATSISSTIITVAQKFPILDFTSLKKLPSCFAKISSSFCTVPFPRSHSNTFRPKILTTKFA